MSILIRGGRVVTATDDFVADILVEGERVALIGADLDISADRTIDAAGKYVLPGCIDPHTHLDMPFGGTVTIDDFESGQGSAACGGTTCHVDFCIQGRGQTFAQALETWHAKANGKTLIDYGFHIAVTDLADEERLEELAGLPEQGITSYKLFMAYKNVLQVDDETLFRAMEVAAASGALVMVHAENGDAIDVVHVTCREAVEPIRRAREQGWDVWGETCTQYLFRSIDDLARPGFEGAKYVYSPPARDAANHDVLWEAVRTDALSAISTDHCAFLWDGQKTLGKDDFTKIPNGGPGLEDRLKMIHHFGVREGRITLNRMVDLLATQPARLFGLYPRKGTVAVGSDADLVIFDPGRRETISASTHHSRCDYSLYEGTEVVGAPEHVLLRGSVLVEDGELVGTPGTGRFVRRARFGDRLEAGAAVPS